MEKDIIYTLNCGERVTGSYAEIYLDNICPSTVKQGTKKIGTKKHLKKRSCKVNNNDLLEWTSPSDLLIGLLNLTPPFTSKITRGKTHEGILAIGNEIVKTEHDQFSNYLTTLISDNDAAWNQILLQEKNEVERKVNQIYHNIFLNKSKIMSTEIATFYEETLQELEDHLRSELQTVLFSARASIISDLNIEIKQKLEKEKNILQKALQQQYKDEVLKVKRYYQLLLHNEVYRNNQLINHAKLERNDALKAFCRQVETDNITSTMYVMCTERKKCKIKQFVLEKYQDKEMTKTLQKIKERQDFLETFTDRDCTLNEINNEWEIKIKKILHLWLKFISFSLKLLPEQTTFLLDFQKMFVLQLNDIQKTPKLSSSILIPEEELQNIFKFYEAQSVKSDCQHEPLLIVGDTVDIPPPQYGSKDTLPFEVDLPTIRVQRQFVYAKCHNFEEIKDLLNKGRCKCSDINIEVSISSTSISDKEEKKQENVCIECESSKELLLVEDIHRLHECPVRGCKDWIKRQSFPHLKYYVDFSEKNFERVKTLLDQPITKEITPELINPKSIVNSELLFGPTNELYHTVETQYSSQEELSKINIQCSCVNINDLQYNNRHPTALTNEKSRTLCRESNSERMIDNIVLKRQNSLKRILQDHTNLLSLFNDESFDFE